MTVCVAIDEAIHLHVQLCLLHTVEQNEEQ